MRPSPASEQSRHFRFHGASTPRLELVEPFIEPDWVEKGDLIGTLESNEGETVVALASYARLRDPASAEAAFAVAEAHQSRGIGTRLLEQLAEQAAGAGIERFVPEAVTTRYQSRQ